MTHAACLLALLFCGGLGAACGGSDGVESHVVWGFETEAELLAYGSQGPPVQVKFIMTRFTEPAHRETRFTAYPFYTLHDQWYWFNLLNGVPIEGYDVDPVSGYAFDTVEDVIAYFDGKGDLPLDLKFAGDRLYSPGFYADGFGSDRFFGLGSILHFEADPDRVVPEELWLIELEHSDDLSEAELTVFFEELARVVPHHIGGQLRWLTRSEAQVATGEAIRAGGGPYADRVIHYTDLVVEGAFVTHNPGITAGKVRIFAQGDLAQASLNATDIVVLAEIPDYLPPVAGIITGVPQTPLSHLNLLAKSRGTPNLYLGGATDNLQLHDYAYFKPYVVMEFTEEGYRWNTITSSDYQAYLGLQSDPVVSLEAIPLDDAPYTVELTTGGLAEMAELLPLAGGKSAQLMAFNDFPDIQTPDLPVGITIRGFAEHVAPLQETLEALFTDPVFEDDVRVRYLGLEGLDAYVQAQPDPDSAELWAATLLGDMSPESPVASVVAEGGVREMIRQRSVASDFASLVEDALGARFGHFSTQQGLRFRSSSTAEDIEGFNGAGLYESHTGFLFPEVQKAKDQHQSVLWALLATWSSYYGFEAFEERRAAGIDHFSAHMGVLVHARFDDDHEISNGVFTLELHQTPDGPYTTLTVNTQDKDLSVTNPKAGTDAVPEIDQVTQWASEPALVARLQPSNQVPAGSWILTEAQLLEIHAQAKALAQSWLATRNGALTAAKQERTLTLDFEYRHMAAGWPALSDGSTVPERFIWKQVRTLSRPITLPPFVHDSPIPGDLLAHTASIDAISCAGDTFEAALLAVYTDAQVEGPFDYATTPFLASLDFTMKTAVEGVSLEVDAAQTWDHPSFASVDGPEAPAADWSTTIHLDAATSAASGIAAISLSEAGDWTLLRQDGEPITGDDAPCQASPWLVTPTEYLKTLLDPVAPGM